MEDTNITRRGFWGRFAAVVGGLAVVPVLTQPAQARSRRRWGWGPGWGRSRSRFRYWGRPYSYGPGYYAPGPYIGPRYYYRGYNAAPYYAPSPYYQPPPIPGGYVVPMNGPAKASFDALRLLET